MKKRISENLLLTVVLGVYLLGCVGVRAICPAVVLPKWDVPFLVLLSLIALVPERERRTPQLRSYVERFLLAALSFGLLPMAAALTSGAAAVRLGMVGGAVFTVTAALFAALRERLASGGAERTATLWSAVGLYLAAQGLMGIL